MVAVEYTSLAGIALYCFVLAGSLVRLADECFVMSQLLLMAILLPAGWCPLVLASLGSLGYVVLGY